MAILSISLAIFNILPIPALDGGRFIIISLNKILGRRFQKIENIAITTTFLFLMGLGTIVAFKDVWTTIFTK
jgi:regulator of sigma E protease